MATTYNITHKRRDTLDAITFNLSEAIGVSTLPTSGVSGAVYKLLSTGVYYTWDGTEWDVVTGGTPIDLTGATLLCCFRKHYYTASLITLTDGYGLTVTDAANGLIKIDSIIIDLPGTTYYYDIQVTFSDGTVKTYIKGTLTIEEDIAYV